MGKEDNADEAIIQTKSKRSKESKIKKENNKKDLKNKRSRKKVKESLNGENTETEKENTNTTNHIENKETQKTENNTSETKEQIKFSKKMKYSITKVSKYDEMADLGFKVSFTYFYDLIFLVSILFPIVIIVGKIITGEEDLSIGTILLNVVIYYLANVICLALIYIFFILIISICMFFITKIVKIKEKLLTWMSLTIYASTLSIIIYEIFFVLDMTTELYIQYDYLIALIIIYIYLGLVVRKKRGGTQNAFYRRNKKKSKKRDENNNPA